jgi:parvulin-like peptidyl-prolyl isomerase
LLKTEEEAQEVLKMANAGEDFAELAKKYSIGSTAENGGDLGFLNRGQLSGAIARVVYGLKKGEIGGPAKTKQGYHIIKLTDWRPGDILTFEEIRDRLAKEYKAKLINNRISELRDSADIHINNELLEGLQID